MDFDLPYVTSIENALENEPSLRGRWRRLESVDSNASAKERKPVSAWRIEIPPGAVICPGVSELWVLIDGQFPFSQPRVVAPSLQEKNCAWPHVEDAGILCLPPSTLRDDPGNRVLGHLQDAIQLLRFDDAKRKSDFQDEFVTYWTRGDAGKQLPKHWSLVTPAGPSREVFRYFSAQANTHIWADSKQQLNDWLRNSGRNPNTKSLEPAWLVWLAEAPVPSEFPRIGADVLALIPQESRHRLIRAGEKLPVLIGAPTAHGPVLVAAALHIASERELQNGFRTGRIPFDRAVKSMSNRPIRRLTVERVDGAYVHGRGRNEHYSSLAGKRVALFGCGSLGSAIAKMLAQAGVGGFVLIDRDLMAAHNTSRHVLGSRTVGTAKADALADALELDFPHQAKHHRIRKRIEAMAPKDWDHIAHCDLIISAGVDFTGDMRLTLWRECLDKPPPHICTWIEAFAVVGHAVAVFGSDDLGQIFDAQGRPTIAMTHWPDTVDVTLREAGCGNVFQPHGAVDLQRTATTAANLCLEVLQRVVTDSCRRAWQGDLNKLAALGGTPAATFDRGNTETNWPWNAPSNGGSL